MDNRKFIDQLEATDETVVMGILPNGVRYGIAQLPSARYASIHMTTTGGSIFDTQEKLGCAHFLEHVMCNGTPTHTSKQILQILEELGSQLDASTSRESVGFAFDSLRPKEMGRAAALMADILCNPRLDDNDVEKERGIILDEENRWAKNPKDIHHETIMKATFGQTDYSLPIVGYPQTIRRMTSHDLRTFHQKHFVGPNMTVVITGNRPIAELKDIVEQNFSTVPAGAVLHLPVATQSPIAVFNPRPEIGLAKIALAMPAPSIDDIDGSNVVRRFSYLLGTGLASRLMQHVREELGYVYGISTSGLTYNRSAFAAINTECKHDLVLPVTEAIGRVMQKFPEGITELEMARIGHAFKYLPGDWVRSGKTFAAELGFYVHKRLSYMSPREFAVAALSVTDEQIIAMAKQLGSAPMAVAISGTVPSDLTLPKTIFELGGREK